jgi:hypothetical protein
LLFFSIFRVLGLSISPLKGNVPPRGGGGTLGYFGREAYKSKKQNLEI